MPFFVHLVQNIDAHKGEGSFLPGHSQDLSCTNSPKKKKTFQVMFVVTQQTMEKKIDTRERKGQYATKTTSAPAVSSIQFLWSVMPISMTALTWVVSNISNRNTIEDFTEEIDDAGLVRQYNFFHLLMRMLCLCLALMNLLLSVALPSSSSVTMAESIPHWVVKSDRLSQDEDRLREDIVKPSHSLDTPSTRSSMRRP